MTSTEREALIEKAAKAAARAVRGVTAHVGLRDRKYAAAAFAVFEEAHAPTDDERMAAHKEAKRRYGPGEPQVRRRVGFEDGAAWAVARRPAQSEPTASTDGEREALAVLISEYINETDDCGDLPHTRGLAEQIIARFRRTVQAEPTPIQVRAAAKAINVEGWTAEGGEHEPGCFCEDCERVCTPVARAALRAASAVTEQGENRTGTIEGRPAGGDSSFGQRISLRPAAPGENREEQGR